MEILVADEQAVYSKRYEKNYWKAGRNLPIPIADMRSSWPNTDHRLLKLDCPLY